MDKSKLPIVQLPEPLAVPEAIADPSTNKVMVAPLSEVPEIDVVEDSIGEVLTIGVVAAVCDPQLLLLHAELDALGHKPLLVSSRVTIEVPHGIFAVAPDPFMLNVQVIIPPLDEGAPNTPNPDAPEFV